MMLRGPYAFRPATAADLTMLRSWLETPEVVRWWGDPEEQEALLREDLDEPGMTMWIVSHDGRPFGYAQHYEVHRWPQPHFQAMPAETVAIDAFIGVPDMIGGGHGSAFLRQLAERLLADGAPCVAIDPDTANFRARRAYARAGFVEQGLVAGEDGDDVLMIFVPGD